MKRSDMRFTLPRRAAAAILACVLAMGLLTAGYAAVGGFRQAVKVWIHGQQTDAVVSQEEGSDYFQLTWEDEDGEVHEMGGGGVAMDADGAERSITFDEYMDQLNGIAHVEGADGGRVMLYYYDQALDITDAFDENDLCKVALEHDGRTVYIVAHGNEDADWALWQSEDGFDSIMEDVNEVLKNNAANDGSDAAPEVEQTFTMELPDD